MRRLASVAVCAATVATTLPLFALAGTESIYYYPKSDGWPSATMSTSPPTYSGPMLDIDDNGEQGRRIDKSAEGLAEADPDKYHEWRANASGLNLNGSAVLTIWLADKHFKAGDTNTVVAYLLDCGPSSCSSPLATASKVVSPPDDVFIQTTLNLPSFEHNFAAGRDLVLRVMVDKSSKDDMTFAYDTTTYVTRLKVQSVVSTTTTTTVAPTTTTTAPPTTTTTKPTATTTSTTSSTSTSSTTSTSTTLGSTTPSSLLPESTTTTEASATTLQQDAAPPTTTSTTAPPPDGTLPKLDSEKSNLVVRTTPAQRGVAIAASSVELSPVEGLMVSFLTAAETVRSQLLASVGLGLIMAALLIIGMSRRTSKEDEAD